MANLLHADLIKMFYNSTESPKKAKQRRDMHYRTFIEYDSSTIARSVVWKVVTSNRWPFNCA